MKSLFQLVENNGSKVVAIGEFGLGMGCVVRSECCPGVLWSGYVTLVLCGVNVTLVLCGVNVALVLCGVDMLPWCFVEWICYPGVV